MEIKSNISFSKLSKNINKIIDRTLHNSAQDSADLSKLNIDNSISTKGGTLKGLANATIRTREDGRMTGLNIPSSKRNEKHENIGGDTPLKYTGNLYNSIKAKKNSLIMPGYAGEHYDGFTFSWPRQTGGMFKRQVSPRPFIETTVGEDTKDKFFKDIEKKLKK